VRAIAYMGPDDIRTIAADTPSCGPGQLKIRVHYAGICGTDMAIAAGKHPRAKAPLIMGHEFAGEVVEINPGDAPPPDVAIGDRVTIYPLLSCGQCHACRTGHPHVCRDLRLIGIDRDGGFAEYVCVPAEMVVKLPADMAFDTGALIEPLAVGMHAVAMADEGATRNAIVLGAGPIGLMVALALRSSGVADIVLTDINASRLERAGDMGFTVLDSNTCDVSAAILDRTAGEGADVLYECAGSESAAGQMCELVRGRGKIVMVGVHKAPHAVDLRTLNFREITMVGARVYTRADYQRAVDAAQQIPAENIISHRLDLDNAVQGFDLMKHPDGACKVLFQL